MTAIEKKQALPDNCRRTWFWHANARTAFGEYLRATCPTGNEMVLLPAYIGWSPREGSGVFDPVKELGLRYEFYRVDERLHIDLDALESTMARAKVGVFVVIHYFGHADPGYATAVSLARAAGASILEDEAHALYTDLVGGATGQLGDACIFSLHKMLPFPKGGVLVVNDAAWLQRHLFHHTDRAYTEMWEFDLRKIAERRVANARRLTVALAPLAGLIDPLWGDPEDGNVPQTYPVIVRTGSRDQLYELMNGAGFGVVSLYHTLIDAISRDRFAESSWLSRHVMNLPVHQDVELRDLDTMVEKLAAFCRETA